MPDDAHARFQQWVSDHAGLLYALAYRLCGDRDLAEELVQETFYQAWRSMGRLKDSAKARPWLMQILRHGYARWARQRRMASVDADTPVEPSTANAPDVIDTLAERDWLQQGLNQLEDRYKVVFLMVFVGGLTCQEAADELDLPLGTVLSRIHRARKHLRKSLTRMDQADMTRPTAGDGTIGHLRLGGDA